MKLVFTKKSSAFCLSYLIIILNVCYHCHTCTQSTDIFTREVVSLLIFLLDANIDILIRCQWLHLGSFCYSPVNFSPNLIVSQTKDLIPYHSFFLLLLNQCDNLATNINTKCVKPHMPMCLKIMIPITYL